jgi:hypothetical protein
MVEVHGYCRYDSWVIILVVIYEFVEMSSNACCC